ncbi:MAG: hypothetical protein F4X11_12680 [Acidobacteria bacterium]|nr:hypothetical protein [Acidobacteriota bacterium]
MPTAAAVIRALGPIDLKSVARDSMLRWLIGTPIVLAFVFRWGIPALDGWLGERYAFDLTPYYPLLTSFLALMTPTLLGSVVGFLLLDQRDDRTLTALQVTPLTVQGYLAYRIAVPMAVSVPVMMAGIAIADLVEMGIVAAFAAAVQAAPAAPLYALFVAAFAANKVQGFALLKGAGVLTWPPVLAWFVASPWQVAIGLDPLYWPLKVFWMLEAGEPRVVLYFLAGLGYQGGLIALLLRRFKTVIAR